MRYLTCQLTVPHVSVNVPHLPDCCILNRKYLLVDPTDKEEKVMDGRTVIGMNKHREICTLQITGMMLLLKDQVRHTDRRTDSDRDEQTSRDMYTTNYRHDAATERSGWTHRLTQADIFDCQRQTTLLTAPVIQLGQLVQVKISFKNMNMPKVWWGWNYF